MTTTTTLEIINGISQVLANAYDGALNEKGEPLKIGLRREEGDPLRDDRIIDGFGATIQGDRLHISYHCEPLLKEVHSGSFEKETDTVVNKVKSFIQKEFKRVTGSSLSLTEPSDLDVVVEYISRVRTSVKAHKCWKSGRVTALPKEHKDPVAKATRDWIEQTKKDKKPQNVTRKS